ncbi:hypothetical protein HIR71_05440 [Cellulomonas fimi]|uniref:Septum formation-related domain-containing protein n=1 Tax=Cellulomonas fimi TaxID=1708 RepID=A0A7Y0LZM1_CELFI|nr:hypothetical protein [Cellulomonas fimi]
MTALLGIGVVGIGLGIAALRRIGRGASRGRGLAIAGVVIGAAWTLAQVVLVVLAVQLAGLAQPLGLDVAEPVDARARQLVTGHCVGALPPDGEIDVVQVVPCGEPHAAQVVSEYRFAADARWPGQVAADRRVAVGCEVTDAEADAGVTALVWAPTEDSWARGDRTGLCLLRTPDPVTGSFLDGTVDLPR